MNFINKIKTVILSPDKRGFFALLIVLGIFAANTTAANAAGEALCPNKLPQASVKISTLPTKYIRDQNADTLTSHHNKGDGLTLGLAGGPIEISIQSSFSISSRNNSACVKLEKLDVLLKAMPEIHIASNFKRGTCEYREVLEHEQKHINVLREFIREYAPKLTREVSHIVRTTQTSTIVSSSHVSKAQDQIQEDIITRINAYQEKIMDVLRYRQTTIDSPEEYERVAKSCNDWNRKLVQKSPTRS